MNQVEVNFVFIEKLSDVSAILWRLAQIINYSSKLKHRHANFTHHRNCLIDKEPTT